MEYNTFKEVSNGTLDNDNTITDVIRANAYKYSKDDLITLISEMEYSTNEMILDSERYEYKALVMESIQEYNDYSEYQE